MSPRFGIALSGGGARGIAHAGVLSALEELHLPPDEIAGTSSGAIVGALYAAGYSAAETLEFFATKSPFKLSHFAFAGPGVIDTTKLVSDFEEYFPDDSFAALDRRLIVTATDLVEGTLVLIDAGRLIPAILASSSVPFVFTPTEVGGRWCVDGGILENLPVEPLRAHCDVVLGVYASPLKEVDRSDLGSSLAVAQRALDIGTHRRAEMERDSCDLVISPPELSRFGLFDTKHHEEIYRIGYEAAMERAEEIGRLLASPAMVGGERPRRSFLRQLGAWLRPGSQERSGG